MPPRYFGGEERSYLSLLFALLALNLIYLKFKICEERP